MSCIIFFNVCRLTSGRFVQSSYSGYDPVHAACCRSYGWWRRLPVFPFRRKPCTASGRMVRIPKVPAARPEVLLRILFQPGTGTGLAYHSPKAWAVRHRWYVWMIPRRPGTWWWAACRRRCFSVLFQINPNLCVFPDSADAFYVEDFWISKCRKPVRPKIHGRKNHRI